MKLGYGNYGMPHTPAETMLRQVAEIGYDGVELCVGPQYPTAPDRLGTADRRRLRAGLLERGLEVSSFMVTGLKLLEPEPAQHKANLDALRRTFELAADLEISSPIVTGTLGGRIEDWPALCPLLAQRVADWAAVAEECGGVYAFEPHVGGLIHSPDRALWLLEEVNRPGLKLKFDYSHFELIDVPLEAAIDQLLPFAVDTHVKDVQGHYPDFKFLLPGESDLDYARYVRLLSEAGYDGFITVEISGMVFNSPGYDALAAASYSYRTMSRAFVQAELERRR